ncbi:MAG: hypothetical protein U1A24_13080 [Cypionkella sp.]|uniref:hypothetical protein n=1 Tax=Cypionkella sp. TaxID=2811411 RepID=UPI002AB83763|nr:hypothetical protein [Cypionkella sp.]MDZ4311474.1 hypothetical protein [Cypionkella sp.]MDZ4394790.1 hypothetical protein [Cypionkella sp.]
MKTSDPARHGVWIAFQWAVSALAQAFSSCRARFCKATLHQKKVDTSETAGISFIFFANPVVRSVLRHRD